MFLNLSLTWALLRLYGCPSRTRSRQSLMAFTEQPEVFPQRSSSRIAAILTDSHFLIPAAVFCVGLTLLITLH